MKNMNKYGTKRTNWQHVEQRIRTALNLYSMGNMRPDVALQRISDALGDEIDQDYILNRETATPGLLEPIKGRFQSLMNPKVPDTTKPINPTIEIGQRVELHPATDHWMRGSRYGKVVHVRDDIKDNLKFLNVKLDTTGEIVKLLPQHIMKVI